MTLCCCLTPPFQDGNFETFSLGIDQTQGRFGEVSLKTCKFCGQKWLHYYLENEAFSKSGRWYRGLISKQVAETVTAETAIRNLQDLEWYFYGGSYFQTTGKKGSGLMSIDF